MFYTRRACIRLNLKGSKLTSQNGTLQLAHFVRHQTSLQTCWLFSLRLPKPGRLTSSLGRQIFECPLHCAYYGTVSRAAPNVPFHVKVSDLFGNFQAYFISCPYAVKLDEMQKC